MYLTAAGVANIMKSIYPDFDREKFLQQCRRFNLPTDKKIKEFSTGMKAKFKVLAALSHKAELLILDEPTRGIDVGTKVDIQKLVLKLASEGMSVTFISSETDEMLRTCSRLVVMRDRKVVGELSGEDLTQTKIMSTIAGGESKHE